MFFKNKNMGLVERSICETKHDCFDVETRIVKKVYDFIQSMPMSYLAIAITGEWGVGKSSVINLLKNKLTKSTKNIVITFEPILEGKLQISEIIELFYLKLSQQINDNEIKNILKKCFKSAAILSRANITGKIGFGSSFFLKDVLPEVQVDYD